MTLDSTVTVCTLMARLRARKAGTTGGGSTMGGATTIGGGVTTLRGGVITLNGGVTTLRGGVGVCL